MYPKKFCSHKFRIVKNLANVTQALLTDTKSYRVVSLLIQTDFWDHGMKTK